MKKFKSHFVFNRSQQNGIFLLLAIIVVLQLVYYFADFSSEKEASSINEEELKIFQAQLDSLKLADAESDTVKIFPFNPNYITDFRGYSLGMSPEEIDRLHVFREEGNWVNSAEDFKQVTGISDSLLTIIFPYFKFPDWVGEQQAKQKKRVAVGKSFEQKQDLNTATAEELQTINGIGETLSNRIVNYRTKIGGFLDDIQLKDVYGLDFETRDKVFEEFTVKEKPEVDVLSINKASVLELSEIPYFDYELAREIIDYRSLHEKIENFEELSKIAAFPSERIDRIELYLTTD